MPWQVREIYLHATDDEGRVRLSPGAGPADQPSNRGEQVEAAFIARHRAKGLSDAEIRAAWIAYLDTLN